MWLLHLFADLSVPSAHHRPSEATHATVNFVTLRNIYIFEAACFSYRRSSYLPRTQKLIDFLAVKCFTALLMLEGQKIALRIYCGVTQRWPKSAIRLYRSTDERCRTVVGFLSFGFFFPQWLGVIRYFAVVSFRTVIVLRYESAMEW